MWSDLATLGLAGCMGFGMGRARLCLLAATHDRVLRRDSEGLRMQALTIALAASLVALTLALGGHGLRLPGGGGRPLAVVAAAVLLAGGFIINDGCYLGSITLIGQGKGQYLFTLAGIFLAERFSAPRLAAVTAREDLLQQASVPVVTVLAGVIGLVAWLWLSRGRRPFFGDRERGVAVAAVAAALLFQLHPGWGYRGAITALALMGPGHLMVLQLAGLAVFAGAVISCWLAGQWRPQRPTLTGGARCLLGGYLMETGAQCVPGGSDTWVFWTIPGGGVHGLIAYAVAVSLLFVWWRARREMAGRGWVTAS
jgi:Sulphur transport